MSDRPNLPVSQEPQFLFYQTKDGRVKIEVRFEGKTVWLPQKLLAELFQVTVPTINEHIKGIYADGELEPAATIRKFRIVQNEGVRQVYRQVDFYNLDMILSVGYRVRSHRGVQFRRWATDSLREYLLKGFVLDDERLKSAGGGGYFDELLARIRDIRSSEKVFWRKVLDIYATSIDYDPSTEMSQAFFATVQNKMHWAAHGHTAAEIIAARADSEKPNMGLTSWTGAHPRKDDVSIAKNYLDEKELDALNRIVTLYLEFAELQALNRKPIYMRTWIAKLDEFLRISERDILTHAGTLSHENALLKAENEYRKFEQQRLAEPTQAENDFEEAVKKLKKLKSPDKGAKKPKGKQS
jgi:hypothetical protein